MEASPTPETGAEATPAPTPSAQVAAPPPNLDKVVRLIIAIPVLLMVGCCLLSTCGKTPAKDDPVLAQRVNDELAIAGVSGAIHDVSATDDGQVIVTLNVTTASFGSKVQAQDAAAGVSGLLFAKVPEVKHVGVFDGNNEILGTYDRP